MAPRRAPRAKPLPRRTAGTNVKHVVTRFGGAGNSWEKTIKRGQEEKVLQNGPKLIFTEQQNSAGARAARRNAHHMHEDDIIPNFGDAVEYTPGVVDDNNDVLKIFPRRRSSDSDDYQCAQNWRKTEDRIVEIMFSGDITPCCCKRASRTVKLVIVGLKDYRVRSYTHCPCGLSAALLVKEGFFPASPIYPQLVFELDLLRTLYEQSVRGAMSKYAWAEGLRAKFEKQSGSILPSFYKGVCTAGRCTSTYLAHSTDSDNAPANSDQLSSLCSCQVAA
jgi:hypothetical protein